MDRPNILFICTDQQSASAMSHAGNAWVRTPHMDALAASGISFRNSFCTYPLCSPARASHFTGLMPHQTGVTCNDVSLSAHLPTLMGPLFRAAGYDAVWAGKWHVPDVFPSAQDTVPGFHCVPLQDGPDEEVDRRYTDEAIRFLRQKHDRPFLLSLQLHDPHEICSVFHDDLPAMEFPPESDLPPLPDNHGTTAVEPDVIAEFRVEEMKGYQNVHAWTDQHWARFCALQRRHRAGGDTEAAALLNGMREARWTDLDWRRYLYVYYRLVERADRQLGRVLTALDAQGLRDSTLIVFTSDHGDGMGAHRWTRKLMFYEECMRTPLCVSWAGAIPSGVDDECHLVSGADILPTLCDYAGIEIEGPLPGRSIRSCIEDPKAAGRDYVVGELTAFPSISDVAWQGRMIRTHHHKYVVFDRGEKREMLFDLERDPLEAVDLAADPVHESMKANLVGLLDAWRRETGDTFVP